MKMLDALNLMRTENAEFKEVEREVGHRIFIKDGKFCQIVEG